MQILRILENCEAEEILSWAKQQEFEEEIFTGKPTC